MIELRNEILRFSFPEVHPDAALRVSFQRTLRIPDDDGEYALPPGLGDFPLRHVDDFADGVPAAWIRHGGVMMPMYQSEAMWLAFGLEREYPCAVKVATGKINAVSGDAWSEGLHRDPQDYVITPEQPWLDGYCVEKGLIRQFVAMPLGAGYTAEEQITGAADHGGLQIVAYPMKREAYERYARRLHRRFALEAVQYDALPCLQAEMGLAPGGRMRQEIYDDPFELDDWDLERGARCFVHIVNSLVWSAITDEPPPTAPPTAMQYTRAGLPWFDYYDEAATAVPGSEALAKLKSVIAMGREKGDVPLPENEPVTVDRVVRIGDRRPDQVREGSF